MAAPVEDGDAVAVVVSVDNQELSSESYQADCFPPPPPPPPPPPSTVSAPVASSSWECGDETIAVTLDNSASTVSVVFDVNGTEYTVDAGETQVVDLAAPVEDGDAVAVVVSVDNQELSSESYQADCFPPPVQCDNGESPVDTGVDGVADTCEPVVCTDGETPVDTGVNGVADTCEQPVVLPDTVTRPAPTVSPSVQVSPAALPRTGTDEIPLTMTGLFTVLLGVALRVMGRRRAG